MEDIKMKRTKNLSVTLSLALIMTLMSAFVLQINHFICNKYLSFNYINNFKKINDEESKLFFYDMRSALLTNNSL
jgi:hypothetical protein